MYVQASKTHNQWRTYPRLISRILYTPQPSVLKQKSDGEMRDTVEDTIKVYEEEKECMKSTGNSNALVEKQGLLK